MTTISEEELWDRFIRGDIEAFSQIYDLYAEKLFQYGKNFTDDQALVEDCMQDLFTRLWEKKRNLNATTSILFYLLASMRRTLLRKIQQENKRHAYEKASERDAFRSITSPESILIFNEEETHMQSMLLDAINGLPVRQREALYLRYFQGLSFDEIANMMSWPKKTAYNLIFKALESMRKQLLPVLLYYLIERSLVNWMLTLFSATLLTYQLNCYLHP